MSSELKRGPSVDNIVGWTLFVRDCWELEGVENGN